MLPLQGVSESDVDLGTVESPVARVQLPGQPQGVQGLGQVLLGLVPNLDVAEELLRPE